MYSDTLIVVISLIIMIIVGLVFRTCCLKLTKQRVRQHPHQENTTRSLRMLAINNNVKGGGESGQEMEMSDIQVADIVERRR